MDVPRSVIRIATVGVAALAVLIAFTVGSGRGSRSLAAAPTPAVVVPTAPAPGAPLAASGPSVTVSGQGIVAGTPDVLVVDFSVEQQAASVSKALDGASAALGKVRDVLHGRGVAERDMQTSGLSVQPNYDYSNDRQRLVGYDASESLSVKLRTLSRAGADITAAVAAGGNAVRVNGLSFDLEGDSALVKAARAHAFADARAKAQQYATLAGHALGGLVSLSETVDAPPVRMPASAAVAVSSAPVPIQPGTQDVAVSVQATWGLS